MPWPGTSLRLAILLLAATVGPPGISSEGYVGCVFSERLCADDEWCYDDLAFGRCLRAAQDVDEDDLYRYSNLEREDLHQLSAELRRLFALGYRWSHAYTQCRLQSLLYATKNNVEFDQNSCTHLVDQDLEGALKALEGQVPLEPQEVAIIKYTPSVDNPHADYADEIYYPPVDDSAQQALRERILPSNAIEIMDMEDPYADYQVMKRSWESQMNRRSVPPQYFTEQYNTPTNFRLGKETRDSLAFLPQIEPQESLPEKYLSLQDMTEMYPIIKYINDLKLTPSQIEKFLSPENSEKLAQMLAEFSAQQEENFDFNVRKKLEQELGREYNDIPEERFTLTYNTPDNFRAGWESRDTISYPEDFPESRIYYDENDQPRDVEIEEYGSGQISSPAEIFRERKINWNYPDATNNEEIYRKLETLQQINNQRFDAGLGKIDIPGIYTEGGVVYARGPEGTRNSWKNHLDKILEKYNLGFKRPERLDVKKPGPPFDIQISDTRDDKLSQKRGDDDILPNMMKKLPRGVHPNPTHELHGSDSDYVYVSFKNRLSTWKQGEDIIRNISSLLHLEPTAFSDGHVDPSAVGFKVQPNSRGLNVTEVAKRIDLIKDQLHEITGVEVVSAGIGDKNKMQTVVSAALTNENQFYIVLFMVCGVLAAMIIAAILLILIKRHIKSREKLQGLSRPDTEASKDYQDLCRARMAAKGQPAGETVHGRITSLSRESEQSPSSRSSTSSWSEEPALHNMDISTGHMVLSYMEDHLKNKDRLEQEWVALCAYIAEPCETSIALKKDNVEKNRYPEIIPYDHARVVLNELSNANSSDYINASSITDHDPRNPAYIATQGPLPHTAPDFWQLIWEQGAVVIVMLTRLTEGGAAMCHRYWPEEGSEVYHIYEVHLVSEHIWCDDYLVRSFYLKNVRTGETRTVTQFHFLSWAEAGVPASTKALLEFRRKVNKSYRGRSCPIVVHCSDGAGRTGTYCLIDMVLSRMAKGAKEIDIAATLEHLRDQRPRMVATKQQFEFVLTAVAEEVHAILKALPPTPAQTQEKEKEKQ